MKKPVIAALSFSLLFSCLTSPSFSAITSVDELKADKLKNLTKRDPRGEELINKAQAKIDKLKSSNPALAARMQAAVDQITFASSGLNENRIKGDMELLDAIAKDHKEPSAEELAPLQERYKKACAKFDDMMISKDLDRALHIHDKLVRYTSLGLWDKDKIASELERMEGLIERAPDIPYGKKELWDTCKNKKLVTVPKLVYAGSSSHEEMYLTGDRRSVGVIDEACGAPLNMDLAEHLVQAPDGKPINFDECNDPSLGLPFSPPLSLWAKTRMLEGRVPAILLKLVDSKVKAENPQYANSSASFTSVADVASGKLDDYFKTNLKQVGLDKTPVMLGLYSDFDREAAATAFGADGHSTYWSILDPKMKAEDLKKKLEKGSFTGPKATSDELCNKYGDAKIPDGPERVRDSWKRLNKIIGETGSSSVAMFCSAGSFHGNKNAGKFAGEEEAGNQTWNKLEYYWPGEGVIDWLGINGVGTEPVGDPKGANMMEALEPFMLEQRSSSWQSTPAMLVNLAPGRSRNPLAESAWINTVFTKMIPATFPNILAIFINIPGDVTLWDPNAKSSFRTYVSSNKFYNFKLRFKSLDASVPAAKAP